MRPGPPQRRRPPYWTLPAFLLLISLPLSWAAVALALLAVARVGAGYLVGRIAAAGAPRATPETIRLGADERGRCVGLEPQQLAAHGLIVGASGAGKSTTLLGILGEQIRQGRPAVVIDLKGSPSFAARLEGAARSAGRPFRLWTPDGPASWNPLARGNPTELKDKLIGTERFTEPHYQRAAERYVQAALTVLAAGGERPSLERVVALLEPRRLAVAAWGLDPPLAGQVQDYLSTLTPDQLSAVRGLGTRLALLSESTAGPFLGAGPGVEVGTALEGPEVVLFSLNSSRYGHLAAQLATLAIQDLTTAAGHRLDGSRAGSPPTATVAVDEFSAVGSDQLLALLARGREAGISVLLATQELADLDRAGRGFRDQVLGLTALKIVHRQDVPGSARTFAEMAGTEWTWEETRQLRGVFASGSASRGTRRAVERFVVHPDEIKRLRTGQAVMLAKAPVARITRLRVARPERDQPAPGVTR